MMNQIEATLNTLLRHKKRLTKQQFRTLWGQAKAGDPDAAMKGLEKLMARRQRNESFCNRPRKHSERILRG
jgi:hypothetical protein